TTDVYADPKVPASRISGPMINATVAPPATIPARKYGQPAYGIPMTLSGFTGNMGQVASKWLMLPLLMIVDPHVVQILAALGVKRGTKSDPRTTDVYADPKVPASRISGPF
ncbi:hypothetical protein, partial [Deinococcus alpinitundrae]|uniref:hypothetical protein n=1 Tax=Deinococcus alpinitundrae TaxID=468913 RepID=UPI00192A1CAF